MKRYSVQLRDGIFVKGYGFLSFAKNFGKNIGENVSKHLTTKCSEELLLMVLNNLQQMHLNLVQKSNSKADSTGDLISNKIADKITKVSKNSQQNNKDIVTNENDKEIPLKRYISPEKRQKIIDDVRVIL